MENLITTELISNLTFDEFVKLLGLTCSLTDDDIRKLCYSVRDMYTRFQTPNTPTQYSEHSRLHKFVVGTEAGTVLTIGESNTACVDSAYADVVSSLHLDKYKFNTRIINAMIMLINTPIMSPDFLKDLQCYINNMMNISSGCTKAIELSIIEDIYTIRKYKIAVYTQINEILIKVVYRTLGLSMYDNHINYIGADYKLFDIMHTALKTDNPQLFSYTLSMATSLNKLNISDMIRAYSLIYGKSPDINIIDCEHEQMINKNMYESVDDSAINAPSSITPSNLYPGVDYNDLMSIILEIRRTLNKDFTTDIPENVLMQLLIDTEITHIVRLYDIYLGTYENARYIMIWDYCSTLMVPIGASTLSDIITVTVGNQHKYAYEV